MRVALVLEQFDPPRGGLEQWSWQFAAELLERGHEVHVVARRFSKLVQTLPIVPHRLGGGGSRLAFAKAAQAELLRLSPDLIHDTGCGWHCDVFHPHGGSWIALSQRKSLLMSSWRRGLKAGLDRLWRRSREFRTLLLRQYVDNGQLLVALSQAVADDFQRLHGVPRERIRVVYNGVNTDRFSPAGRTRHRRAVRHRLGIPEEKLLALIVAHNFQLKGLPTLLQALSRLADRRLPVHLLVVGGRRLRPWRRMAARMGVDRAVTFLGSTDDTAPYYAAADLYVHPTHYDPCSLVVLEAAASGLPVITTRINGVSELLSDGVDSLLISDPADADQLAGQMQALFDGQLRRAMGEAARKVALRHTLGQNVEQILAVYEEAVGARPSSRCPARQAPAIYRGPNAIPVK